MLRFPCMSAVFIAVCFALLYPIQQGQAAAVQAQDFEAIKRAAEKGNAKAQYNLGAAYAAGRGVAINDEEAVKWYRLAAEQGHARAQYNLGVAYANGSGVAQNDEEAVKWYRLAAEQGNALAQNRLGWMYDSGRGVAQNDEEAVKWYSLAAEHGHVFAKDILEKIQQEQPQPPETSAQCKYFLDNKVYEQGKESLLWEDKDGAIYYFNKGMGMLFPGIEVSINGEKDYGVNFTKAPNEYTSALHERIDFFEYEGSVYAVGSNRHQGIQYYIYVFKTESRVFEQACYISSEVVKYYAGGALESNKAICQKVIDKNYKVHKAEGIQNILSIDDLLKYQRADLASPRQGLQVDYNNDGTPKILVRLGYSSIACDYSYFGVYNASSGIFTVITTGKPGERNDPAKMGDGYSISCKEGEQEIISIDKKHYLLTLSSEFESKGLDRLDEIIADATTGLNKVENICSFKAELKLK